MSPTGILLHLTKQILFVPFCNFPGNTSASHPNSFDSPFFQMSLVFSSFYCIKYLYCRISPVSGSTTLLARYQGNGSYSICVDMLCVAIVVVGYILIISSCVTRGTSLGATLGGLPGLYLFFYELGLVQLSPIAYPNDVNYI